LYINTAYTYTKETCSM